MTFTIEPSFIDTVLTTFVAFSLIAASGACLWLLPWTDQSIRETDKLLNPIDLTRDDLRLQRLVAPRA